jgi:hypothetical protein
MKKKLLLLLKVIIIGGLAAGLFNWTQRDKLEGIILKAEVAMNGKIDIWDIVYIEHADNLPIPDNSVAMFLEAPAVSLTMQESQAQWNITRHYIAKLQHEDTKYFYLFIIQDGFVVMGQRCDAKGLTIPDIKMTKCYNAPFYFPVPEEYTRYKND